MNARAIGHAGIGGHFMAGRRIVLLSFEQGLLRYPVDIPMDQDFEHRRLDISADVLGLGAASVAVDLFAQRFHSLRRHVKARSRSLDVSLEACIGLIGKFLWFS